MVNPAAVPGKDRKLGVILGESFVSLVLTEPDAEAEAEARFEIGIKARKRSTERMAVRLEAIERMNQGAMVTIVSARDRKGKVNFPKQGLAVRRQRVDEKFESRGVDEIKS
ncbi:MAG: hypothetical protein Q9208_008153 [Pyrenodesmia sp. 3 TL-2023]